MNNIYRAQKKKFTGTSFNEIKKHAMAVFNQIKSKSKRGPFTGITKEKEIFYVQIKENKRTGRKDFISVFPELNN